MNCEVLVFFKISTPLTNKIIMCTITNQSKLHSKLGNTSLKKCFLSGIAKLVPPFYDSKTTSCAGVL